MQFILLLLILPVVLGGAIPGQERCAWGPSYWCSHVSHARECGATQHCLQTVWKNQIIKPKSTETCTYCELIVNAFRDAIQQPATQAQIEAVLVNVCAILPNSDARDICQGVVQEYVPELIQMFEKDITTDMICATLGLCSGLEDNWSPYGVKATNNTFCSDCTKFFTDVQQTITSNETLNQLLQLLNQTVCSSLGVFSDTCIDLAKQYLPIALQTLASQLDPNIVCRIFGFCSVDGAKVDVPLMKNIFSQRTSKGVIKFRSDEECALCEDFVKEFDALLEDPSKQNELYNEIRNNFCAMTGVFVIQCHQFTMTYLPGIIKYLAYKFQMDPSITCKIVGLCPTADSKENMLQLMKHMFTVRKTKAVVGDKVGDEECDICKDLFKQIDEFIRDKANQDKFIYEVKNVVCPELGSFQDECKELVDEYAPMLFELLVNELDPSTVCEQVGFCPVPSLFNVEQLEVDEPAGMVGAGYVKKSEECVLCETIQVFVDNLLKKNETVETVDDLMNKVCKRLPTKLLDEHCENFVDKFGKEMIEKLANEKVCQLIDVCPKPSVEVKKVTDGKCQLCQLFISISESLVANMSQDEILKDLRALCSFIPGNISATCLNYVNEYGPLVISALKSKEDPKTLCELMQACTTKHLPYMTKPIPETLPALKAPSEECEFCNTAVVMLKFYLENKATEAELEKALEGLCKYAGNLTPLCQSLVKAYGDKIIAMVITELDANEICTTLRLCKEVKKQASALSAIMSPYNLPAGKVIESEKATVKVPPKCELCGTVVVMMKYYLNSNQTDDEIKQAMEALCQNIPLQEVSGLCKSLVDEYIVTILDLLRQELNATSICTKLGFCKDLTKQLSSVSVIMSPYDTLPLIQPEDKKDVKSTSECDMCKEAINMMKSFIKENSTEDEIKKVVETFCDKIPSSFKLQCDGIIKQYGNLIIDLLVKKVDTATICKEIKLCTASISDMMSPYNTLPIVQHVSENKVPESRGNAVECEVCTYIMNVLENKLQDNKTEENIKAILKDICKDLPASFTDQCTKFVDQYAQAVINFIVLDISPDEICKKLTLCSSDVKQLPKPVHVQILKDVKGSVSNIDCDVCKTVMTVVDKFLGENRTEESIRDALEKVCGFLPDTISSECKQLVDTYGDKLIQLLLQNLDPETICREIGLCSAQTMKIEGSLKSEASVLCVVCEFALREIDAYLKGNRSEVAITAALEKVCSLLPDTISTECKEFVDTYGKVIINLLVQNIDPKTICTRIGLCTGKTVSPLVDILPVKDIGSLKSEASPLCAVCEFAIKQLDVYLKGNRSKVAITTALDEVCSMLPDTLSSECEEFVNTYGDVIISLLVQNIDPKTICTRIGLCTGKTLSPAWNKESLELGSLNESEKCKFCKLVMTTLDNILKENRTEEAIREALDKVCGYLPTTIKDECKAFVNEYTDLVVKLVAQGLTPELVCSEIKLCSSGKMSPWGAFVKILPDKQKGSEFCVPCKFLIKEIEEYVQENKTAEEIEQYIRKLCNVLPDTVTAQCHDLVDEYIPAILTLIGQNLKPEEICQQLKFCNATVTHSKDDNTLFFKPHRLVGVNKCTYGPAYWCANKDNAAECDAMEHCMRHVWN